jgi:hypothetical protein
MNALKIAYRLVNKRGDGIYLYQLQEVEGKFYFISTAPCLFYGTSVSDIEQKFKLLGEALKLPVIEFSDILEYTLKNVPLRRFE